MGRLRLDPDLQRQYHEEHCLLSQVRRDALSQRDRQTFAAADEELRCLTLKFRLLQAARGPQPPTALERENALTLEQRIDRIEQHLCLGRYHKDFDHG